MAEAATIDACLRIVPEFRGEEHEELRDQLRGKLESRLKRWDAEQVEMELSVKDRGSNQQKVTLEVWIAARGRTRFVGTSTLENLHAAVTEARDDVHRQIDKFVTKRESARTR